MLIIAVVLLINIVCAVAIRCPDCGKTPIPYPLSTTPTCGHQSYKIRCDMGVLKFDTVNATYPIISISPKNQRLVIGHSHLLPNTCVMADFVTQGLQLNNTLPFSISLSNSILFFNCTEITGNTILDCSPTNVCQAYQNSSSQMSMCRKVPRCCSFKKGSSTNSFNIPIKSDICTAYSSFVNLDISLPIGKWPDPAVELMWALPPEPPCTKQMHCDSTSTCKDANIDGTRRCLCNPNFRWDAIGGQCVKDLKRIRAKRKCLAITICSSGIIFVIVVFVINMFIRRQRIKAARQRLARERQQIVGSSSGGKSAKLFTSKEIKKATNNFLSTGLLGVGGFGEVYKGVLDDSTPVAVKCAKLENTKSIDQVLNEVRILCQVNHKNLVHLLGCCVELKQPFLVYEYIPNGSLHDHLHGQNKQPLTWSQRLAIVHDTAEGLAYLHFSASPPIYHRDVKSSNILLDDRMRAKVADFGLSRLAQSDVTHVTTCAQGTLGYLDPDYYRTYQLTDKSDVYSFGVLLLEILTCQKAIDFSRPTDDVNLVAYVKRIVNEERMVDVIDSMLKIRATSLEIDAMKALGFLAISCLEEHRENRPSMKEATEEIEYIMGIVATMSHGHGLDS